MPKIWSFPHVGTLTGTMRIPLDKSNGGTANDTAHVTPDDLVDYVEANADIGGGDPSDATPAALGTAAAGVATTFSRGDHAHAMPTATQVGAAPALAAMATGQLLAAGAGGTVVDAGATVADFGAAFTGLTTDLTKKAPLYPAAGDGDATSSYTIPSSAAGTIRGVLAGADPIDITIPHTLWEFGGTGRSFYCDLRITGTTSPITFLGSGGIAITYHGKDPGTTALAVGDRVRIEVVSATVAHVIVTPAGESASAAALEALATALSAVSGVADGAAAGAATAQTTASDALHPLVQTTHTTATKTLAAGDAGDVIPLDSTSTAIAVTIPHTLFASGGAGRAFVCQLTVVGFVSAISFTGSGGLTLKYYGKAAVSAVDDVVTILVESATVCRVHIGAKV